MLLIDHLKYGSNTYLLSTALSPPTPAPRTNSTPFFFLETEQDLMGSVEYVFVSDIGLHVYTFPRG